jgi:predicted transcriptional regulator
MILTDSEVDERLASQDNIVNIVDMPDYHEARESNIRIEPLSNNKNHGPSVPDFIRRLIAQTANGSDDTQSEIAGVFGVSQNTVSKLSRGLVANRLDTELRDLALKSKEEKSEKAHDLALDSLVSSLALVQDNLATITTAKEAAKIATDMSRVVSQLKGKDDDEKRVNTLVVIKMPAIRKESQFEVIDV